VINALILGLCILGTVSVCLVVNVILPNVAAGRAFTRVRQSDHEGIEAIARAHERGEISTKGKGLGWDVEGFAGIFLLSFTYVLQDNTPRRYAIWWVHDPESDKVTKVSRPEEFIDGFLLTRCLNLLFPREDPGRNSTGSLPAKQAR